MKLRSQKRNLPIISCVLGNDAVFHTHAASTSNFSGLLVVPPTATVAHLFHQSVHLTRKNFFVLMEKRMLTVKQFDKQESLRNSLAYKLSNDLCTSP